MRCHVCAGACCESFTVPAAVLNVRDSDDARWVRLHATLSGRSLTFEVRCTALTPEGRCSIYERRPAVCRFYEAGGSACLETVRTRRTPEQYQLIRDPQDPVEIHCAIPRGEDAHVVCSSGGTLAD